MRQIWYALVPKTMAIALYSGTFCLRNVDAAMRERYGESLPLMPECPMVYPRTHAPIQVYVDPDACVRVSREEFDAVMARGFDTFKIENHEMPGLVVTEPNGDQVLVVVDISRIGIVGYGVVDDFRRDACLLIKELDPYFRRTWQDIATGYFLAKRCSWAEANWLAETMCRDWDLFQTI